MTDSESGLCLISNFLSIPRKGIGRKYDSESVICQPSTVIPYSSYIYTHISGMIDILFCIILLLAIIKGWRRGLLLAVFSVICCLLGLAAAVKLSAFVAAHLESDLRISSRWLPVIAFIIVFLMVALLVRWAANLLEKVLKMVFLEWLNKLGGMVLYIILYISIYSVILFYGTHIQIISPGAIASSRVYPLIAPWGPGVIHFIGKFIPFGQDMFAVLEVFFDKMARHMH